MVWTVLQIAIGGALGAVGRYLTGMFAIRVFGNSFPFATPLVNIIGSFAIGILFVICGGLNSETGRYSALMMTGFIGGYTTFSAYSLDCWLLLQQGRIFEALLFALGTASFSIVACIAGIEVARLSQG